MMSFPVWLPGSMFLPGAGSLSLVPYSFLGRNYKDPLHREPLYGKKRAVHILLKCILVLVYYHSPRFRNKAKKGYYCPQRSWGKIMFLHVCVILFTGGVCLSACWDTHPPWQGRPPPPRGPSWQGKPPWQGSPPPWQGRPPWQGDPPCPPGKADPPAQCMLGETVNKRAVCILLECNPCLKYSHLILFFFLFGDSPLPPCHFLL